MPEQPVEACREVNARGQRIYNPDLWHPVGSHPTSRCPVRTACLAEADRLEATAVAFGMWGGQTPEERISRRRKASRTRKAQSPAPPVVERGPREFVPAWPVRKAMLQSGLSRQELADRTGLMYSTVKSILDGSQASVTVHTAQRVQAADLRTEVNA